MTGRDLDRQIARLDAAIERKAAVVAKLEASLARAQDELSELKRQRRALVGGRASGAARRLSPAAERLRAKYAACNPMNGTYGLIRKLAAEVGLSERQAHRILRDLKPKGPWWR